MTVFIDNSQWWLSINVHRMCWQLGTSSSKQLLPLVKNVFGIFCVCVCVCVKASIAWPRIKL